ncbi:unnamed protein product [Diabrotica balteata]|uniref:Uncharacterized protein n=1 Tax=Diabrotica balteata TaxID=107213 RepID=A0A9N9X8B0_DIABA|nr:unnamed protein product [Diabrotica balteata]
MRSFFCIVNLKLQLQKRIVKCYVYSVLYYGVESSTLNLDKIRRLNAFEMWNCRIIIRVFWVDRVRNNEVLRRIGKEKEVELTIIKERMLQYLGYVMRGEKYGILRLIMHGTKDDRRSIGRR